MKRIPPLLVAIIIYSILFGGSAIFWHDKFQASVITSLVQKDYITLLFTGDIMLDRGVEFYITQHNDWKWPFLRIANTLQEADLVFGNLESVISDKGENLGSIYSFRADPKALEGLTFAGFDVLSVANNHSLDYGMDALRNSMNRLKETGITPIGAGENKTEAYSPTIVEVKGVKVGFLAYTTQGSPAWEATETGSGVAWIDTANLQDISQQIDLAKRQADLLIVSVHFGEEYQTQPNETQKLIAKSAIDAGANIVIGHHPHVVQLIEPEDSSDVRPEDSVPREPERPVERYKDGWIAYSLGNFVFDQGFSPETMEGILLEVKIEGKQITQVIPRVIRMNDSFQPELLISQ